jgi:hypothetical protein
MEEHCKYNEKTRKGYLKKDLGHFKDTDIKRWKCGTPPIASLASFVTSYLSTRKQPRKQVPNVVTRVVPTIQIIEVQANLQAAWESASEKSVEILWLHSINSLLCLVP